MNFIKQSFYVVAAICFTLACACAHSFDVAATPAPQEKSPGFTAQDAKNIIAESRKIVSPNGIDSTVAVPINGIKQILSIRGNDNRNPILLFLHGGPASPDLPLAYTFQRPWEDYFTVVQWDQRGTGKTYAANDPDKVAPTLTIEQMTDDAEQVVRYLQSTYHKRKIFLLGHSWGTVLGVRLAQRHPEWFYAYIGVGQVVNVRQNEALGYQFAMQQAREHQNTQAQKELASIAPYPGDGDIELKKIGLQRQWLSYYGGLAYGRTSYAFDSHAEELSPDYSEQDLDAIGPGSLQTLNHLLRPLSALDLSSIHRFECPIFLFLGRHDYAVSHELAAQWFTTLQAPSKRLVWFADSAHMIMQEQPGRFLLHLVNDVRPIAVQANDAAPDDVVSDH
ncbi:alpha/beta fold hydrolase [Dyella silvatica]|uniref:alpha/beta fold hydrolase n=1 Tax=Dyella silvatica TaxID=2992128 RepID=UPI0022575190|nr:alpha/beta hydrolase [Dyella silvatica]